MGTGLSENGRSDRARERALFSNVELSAVETVHMTISVPTNVSIAGLRGEFMDFCDHLNFDAIMEPVK